MSVPDSVDSVRLRRILPAHRTFVGFVLVLGLWAGINTGPWNIHGIGSTLMGTFHGLRVYAPGAVIFLAVLSVSGRHSLSVRVPTAAEVLWMLYGGIGISAGLAWRAPGSAFYWGTAFLAGFLVVEHWFYGRDGDDLDGGAKLNQLNWLITGLVLLVLMAAAADVLLIRQQRGWSAYGVVHRMGESIAGMAMSRASGLGRMSAIVAIVLLPVVWRTGGWKRVAGAVGFAAATSLLVVLSSRGALGAFAVGGFVLFLCLIRDRPGAMLLGGVGLLTAAVVGEVMYGAVQDAVRYLGRGGEAVLNLSGRGKIWSALWDEWMRRPLLGFGFQSDRLLTGRTAHNGPVYALVTAGGAGLLCYLGGLLVTWYRLIALLRRRWELLEEDTQLTLLQVAGVLAVLTARHFPENTSALFSIDFLVMLPAVAYVGSLYRSFR